MFERQLPADRDWQKNLSDLLRAAQEIEKMAAEAVRPGATASDVAKTVMNEA
jgi:hypothetical protein